MKRIILFLLTAMSINAFAQDAVKIQKKADKGDTKAMIELAHLYEVGHGVAVDSAKALALFQKAVSLGDADAKAHLGRYTLYTSFFKHDTIAAYQLFKESADAGSTYGTYRLGVCYLRGIGVAQDVAKAHQLIEQSAAKGDPDATNKLAYAYFYGQDGYAHDVEEGVKYAKKVADKARDFEKYDILCDYYFSKQDTAEGLKWIKRGIESGNIYAILNSIANQFLGKGIKKDEQGALNRLAQLMKKFPNDNSLYHTEGALRNISSDPTIRDTVRILECFEKSESYAQIGNSYMFGSFTPIDSAKAHHYWHLGADDKNDNCIIQLAIAHYVAGNIDSMEYYCRKADEQFSNLVPTFLIGVEYAKGNLAKAAEYGWEAGERGDEESRVNAGRIYLDLGDTVKAANCFKRAIYNQYFDAYQNLSWIQDDIKNALKISEKGGKAGCKGCYIDLGKYYEYLESYKKAEKYYKLANNPKAFFLQAKLIFGGAFGKPTENEIKKAHNLLLRSANGGDEEGTYMLTYCYEQGIGCEQSYDSATVWYRRLAEIGDPKGIMGMGVAYEHGRGVERDTLKALEYYIKAGDAGYGNGYAYAGDFYRHGIVVQADSTKAFELYQKGAATEENNAAALYNTADCYMNGIGVEKDSTKAVPYLRAAIKAGSAMSASTLGDLFYYGVAGLDNNIDSAINYYLIASKQNDPRANYMIGAMLNDDGNYEEAMPYIISAAKNGIDDAAVMYAQSLLFGHGLEPDPDAALKLLEHYATNEHNARAYLIIGAAYSDGIGYNTNQRKAVAYFDTAANLGNTQAMLYLARCYAEGNGVERDTVKSLQWYERTIAAGNTTAMNELARYYMTGVNVPQNSKRAAELYQRSADNGNIEGLCHLGICYEEGEGVILNSNKAYNLYTQAAERGSAYGMRLLALCYVNGVYVKKDDEQAAKWFLESAKAGDLQSCYIIGMLYKEGQVIKKNNKEAKRWLQLAADNGHPDAAEALKGF